MALYHIDGKYHVVGRKWFAILPFDAFTNEDLNLVKSSLNS